MAVNLVTSFPFYNRPEDVTRRRHWCPDAGLFVQPTTLGKLPSWIIEMPTAATPTVKAHNVTTGRYGNITPLLTLTTTVTSGRRFLIYDWTNINLSLEFEETLDLAGSMLVGDTSWESFTSGCSTIELIVSSTAGRFYSETFFVEPGLSIGDQDPTAKGTSNILIEWSDAIGVGRIPYKDIVFSQHLWLPSDGVGRPTYEREREGNEDGNKRLYPDFQKLQKRQRFEVYAPEYIADALALMSIHSAVVVTDQYAQTGTVFDVELEDPDWSESACQARLTVAFSRDFATKANC